jgi:nonsense-mediated mRNA decay protein 3
MAEEGEARTREKWRKFCPQCGKETEEFFESVCEECFRRGITLLGPETSTVSLSVCARCGEYFKGQEPLSIEEVALDAVRKAIRKKYGHRSAISISGVTTELSADERSARVHLVVRAKVQGVVSEEAGVVLVKLNRMTCDRCSRIAGGYYAGIVQVRAAGRWPTDEELEEARVIAISALGEGDFITKDVPLKEGLDLFVSSIEFGRRISQRIVKQLGGHFTESWKLFGRKGGRNIYRVAFAVRLPGFREGEVVALGEREILLQEEIAGKGMEGVDQTTGERVFVRKRKLKKAKRV